ncbi:MAG TPA: SPASM domain-containing protein, partial [Victivallales bacterium]|nr:SPASM domain-containing protein [Victivallales bacterium]
MYFTFDGYATLCARDYNGELIVGNIKEESFLKIWNGSCAEAIRKKHINKDVAQIESCHSCLDTYRLARTISNEYIHYYNDKYPNAEESLLPEKLNELFWIMDEHFKQGNLTYLKDSVQKMFSELS